VKLLRVDANRTKRQNRAWYALYDGTLREKTVQETETRVCVGDISCLLEDVPYEILRCMKREGEDDIYFFIFSRYILFREF
jgi:hypothetical protein